MYVSMTRHTFQPLHTTHTYIHTHYNVHSLVYTPHCLPCLSLHLSNSPATTGVIHSHKNQNFAITDLQVKWCICTHKHRLNQ
ncbi:hypothetical protein GBAR_LOCUS14999 [Geodia barretti]|uniref:Uncharacterized protein n=1 Tax=Geodia barretti TaxID=519541 RepID=A0AA35S9N7_GEOBA|nr:hypothetical protein GBAR_LOCUS14999 [Geodia barretti]